MLEILLELFIKGAVEGITSQRLSNPLRYLLFCIIFSLFFCVAALLIYFGILVLNTVTRFCLLAGGAIIALYLVKLIKAMIITGKHKGA